MAHVLADNLREAVLQAAMQGKLTKQLKTDTAVQFTLSNIQKEKEQLIINKLIKKEKELSSVEENEIPFDIPACWKWKRLGEVTLTNIGLTYHPQDVSNKGTLVLRSSNIKNGRISYSDNVYVSMEIPESSKIHKGDILICVRNGSRKLVGKAAIVDKEGMAFGAFMAKIHTKWVNPNYVKYYLASHTFRGALDDVKTETINQITQTMLKNKVIPIPPIEEQQRIVERVDELMTKIDEYEKLENQLVQLKEQFPKDMRDSLLQAGMMGQLTEQLTSDTSVETTLNHVKSQRDMVCNKKSVKQAKEKKVLFHLPSEWCLVKIEDVMSVLNGDRGKNYPSKSKLQRNGKHPFISALNLNNNEVSNDGKLLYLSEEQYNLLRAGKLKNNDRLMCIRGSLGKHAKFTGNTGAIASSLVILRVFENGLNQNYLDYFLDSALLFKQITKNDNGTAQPNLSAENLKKFMIPFPPIEEQQRIVDKLDEMLPLVDALAQMD